MLLMVVLFALMMNRRHRNGPIVLNLEKRDVTRMHERNQQLSPPRVILEPSGGPRKSLSARRAAASLLRSPAIALDAGTYPSGKLTTGEFGYHGLFTDSDGRWQTSSDVRGAVNRRQYTSARSNSKDRDIA
jgi:hypothetical protein